MNIEKKTVLNIKIKKILSYIWPQTNKILSDHNGMLEVTYINGKKVLDSKSVNYSYGSLQKILELGISKTNFENVNTVLLLGLGGGSVLKTLQRKLNTHHHITALELDAQVIKIAEKEFGVTPTNKLNIVHSDAFEYMKKNTLTYDFVIVDLFIDQKVPVQFYTKKFCDYLYTSMSNKGSLLFNLGINTHDDERRNKVQHYFKQQSCETLQQEKILGTNTLLMVNKI